MPPVETYNCSFRGSQLAHAVRTFAEKGLATRSLAPFGYGDGGGGPTREMLEKARRLRSLEGSPRVEIEKPSAFFAAAEAEYGRQAPVWSGEMYLELHRATFTTQIRTKQGNRRSEHLLREAELWAATAALRVPGYAYPYDRLDRIWKTVLLHQFHDILPGTSIAWVHREAHETYQRLRAELEGIVAAAIEALGFLPYGAGAGGDGHAGGPAAAAPEPALVLNAAPYGRAAPVVLPDGRTVWAEPPALGGAAAGHPRPGVRVSGRAHAGGYLLDNGLLRVSVDADGLLASVYDLTAGREVLAAGSRGNLLQVHPDHPNKWDAWDIDRHYRRSHADLVDAESVELTDAGPLRAAVRVVRAFGISRIVHDIVLPAGNRRVEITTEVDWQESEKVLKAAFPLDLLAERAASEIQFGHVHRPTHTNTGWDAARFETYAHRWVHLAEPGYGVAVLNDSTYGHDITRTRHGSQEDGTTGTTVRLTLLRAPRSPDPRTDRGVHRLRYTLLPGAGIGDAVAEGLALNLPPRAVARLPVAPGAADPTAGGRPDPPVAPVVGVDHPAITVESVKLADDRSGDVIVRLYESCGGRASGTLTSSFPLAEAHLTDLLERPQQAARAAARAGVRSPAGPAAGHFGDGVAVQLRPFQILTVRLRPDRR